MSVAGTNIEATADDFESGGVRCRGWFHRPDGDPPFACVVLAHGFGAAPNGPLGHIARHFANAGLAAFAFDFRNFGASDGEPRQVLEIARQLQDWTSAIARVRSRDDVDPERVGLWGSSLTGGEVLCLAAQDHRIAAAVAQAPYCDGLSIARAAGLRHNLRMAPAVVLDLISKRTRRPPHLIDAMGPPGAPAAISTRFADLYGRTLEQLPAWPNKVAARVLLDLYRFRPVSAAREIRCPLLVVVSYIDRVAPPGPAVRAAQGLPYVELAMFEARHFDLYSGDAGRRALQTETRFLVHHLSRLQDGLLPRC